MCIYSGHQLRRGQPMLEARAMLGLLGLMGLMGLMGLICGAKTRQQVR